jgi:hypothetical protein
VLEETEALRSADGHFVFLHLLQLVDAVTDVNPASCAGVFYYRIGRVLLGRDLVDRLAIPFQDFAGVACSHTSGKHGSVCSDGYVAYWEKVVLRVIVGIDVNFSGRQQYEGRVDVDGELDVAVFVPVEFELSLLLGGLVKGLVLLLLILHLLLDYLVDFAEPLGSSEYLGLGKLEGGYTRNSHFVDLR